MPSIWNTHERNNGWRGLFGRVHMDGYFSTITTTPHPTAKQGQVLHPDQDRMLSVRELARAQVGGWVEQVHAASLACHAKVLLPGSYGALTCCFGTHIDLCIHTRHNMSVYRCTCTMLNATGKQSLPYSHKNLQSMPLASTTNALPSKGNQVCCGNRDVCLQPSRFGSAVVQHFGCGVALTMALALLCTALRRDSLIAFSSMVQLLSATGRWATLCRHLWLLHWGDSSERHCCRSGHSL